jgi:hypothetical protein
MIDELDALKHCPFCGSEPVYGMIDDAGSPDNGGHFIQCTNACCGASMGLVFACGDDPKPLLKDRWNNRVNAKGEKE